MNEPTKRCPFCGEEILEVAIKCKHCGEFLNNSNSTKQPPSFNFTKQPSKNEPEKLIWEGVPRYSQDFQGYSYWNTKVFITAGVFLPPFGIYVGANAQGMFIIGLSFIGLGLVFALLERYSGPSDVGSQIESLINYFIEDRVSFTITNKRVYVTTKSRYKTSIKEILIEDIDEVYFKEGYYGTGTINLSSIRTGASEVSLFYLNNPHKIKDIINKLRNQNN